jgi:hypothetical protein
MLILIILQFHLLFRNYLTIPDTIFSYAIRIVSVSFLINFAVPSVVQQLFCDRDLSFLHQYAS